MIRDPGIRDAGTREGGRPALVLRGIEKSFPVGFWRGRRRVLRGIDLRLEAGGALGLVGPNGSGKTTLLSMASGVERPTAGEVLLFGAPPADPTARRRIGYLPESSPYPPELSARDVLELRGSLFGLARDERRARAAALLERVALDGWAGTKLRAFSGGMLRRLGLAAAFLHEPDLLLLDEPTAGLDAPGHAVLGELLSEARERGAALVISSHHLDDVLDHCERMAVLVAGRVVAAGEPLALVAARGRIRLDVEGLDAEALARVEIDIERAGGRVVARGPATGTLIELYRERAGAGG